MSPSRTSPAILVGIMQWIGQPEDGSRPSGHRVDCSGRFRGRTQSHTSYSRIAHVPSAVVCFLPIMEKDFVAGQGRTRRGTNEAGQTGGQADVVTVDTRLAGDEREDTSRGEP